MNQEYPYWLTKEMVSGIKTFNLDAYLVALEGWRRGLKLKWYYDVPEDIGLKIIGFNPVGKIFSLQSDLRTHYFYRSRGDKVSSEAVDIGTNKHETKRLLSMKGVLTPEGRNLSKSTAWANVVKNANDLGYPLVLKPTYGSLGKGVYTNIKSESELEYAFHLLKEHRFYHDFILERYLIGNEMRIYVVGNKVIAAVKRIPANVTGDGVHTIKELIHEKNKQRQKNPHLSTRLIKVDEELIDFIKRQEYTLDTVLAENESIYLNGRCNISSGGDSIDVTDELSDRLKDIAVQAIHAIPNLEHAGVDVIVNKDEAQVIEINPTAGIALHTFPYSGNSRNVAKGIIDYYFPETKGKSNDRDQIYFDYKGIRSMLLNKSVKEVEVTDAPDGKLYAKRYVISGKVQKVGYRKWIRDRALENGLHGYARNLRNNKVVVVVASTNQETVEAFKQVCMEGSERAEVEDLQEYDWENQIRVGFEIKPTRK